MKRRLLAAIAAICAALVGSTAAAMASTAGRPVNCIPTDTVVDTTDPSRDCVIVLPGSTIVVPDTVPGEPEVTTTTVLSDPPEAHEPEETTTTTARRPSTTVERLGEDGRPNAVTATPRYTG
jgi:hypothetical protein